MGKKEAKTNAMRLLDRLAVPYEHFSYEAGEFVSGEETAEKLGLPPEEVYKTLVTKGQGGYFVFVIPILKELDLKAAARAAGVKSLEMLHVKDLLAVTGYVRGGCTSLGMKKDYPVWLDSSAEGLEKIYVSAGRIGAQIRLAPADLLKANGGKYAAVTKAQ